MRRVTGEKFVRKETLQTLGMAGGIIGLAAIAAWMGLAHGCEAPNTQSTIGGRVVIAPELASKVSPTDTLFVIVRRPGGQPRPLAVKRIDGPQFPVNFEITNADVMVQGMELRGMVDIVARVDKDGKAGQPQPGDLEGQYDKNPTLPGGKDLEIVIRKVY
jgi:cytochrome c-type biogenesis protein CcmH